MGISNDTHRTHVLSNHPATSPSLGDLACLVWFRGWPMKTLEYGKTWEGFPYVSIIVEGYAFPGDMDHYLIGIDPPNYPVPALPQIHQWDYSLWWLIEVTMERA